VRRVAERTPKLDTTSGVRYVNAALSQTSAVARPSSMTPSWFIAKNAVPTINATGTVLLRCCGSTITDTSSRLVDHVDVVPFNSTSRLSTAVDKRRQGRAEIPPY